MSQEQLYRLIALLQIFGDTYKIDTKSAQDMIRLELVKLEDELNNKE